MARMTIRAERRMRVDGPAEQGWVVCVGDARSARDGRVDCPVRDRRVPLAACLLCRHLETLAGERDDTTCLASNPIMVPPYPR
jgi:hypothetical protein